MMNTKTIAMEKKGLSVKAQSLAIIGAVAAGVAIPQLVHTIGSVSGLGTSLGEALLPMHLPIMLVGLLAGPYAGVAAGILTPVLSHLLTGMPMLMMLPFIGAELVAYGLIAGLLKSVKLSAFAKLLVIQIGGRAVRAVATLLGVYAFGSGVAVASIWTSIVVGLLGIVLQWILLPLIMFRIEHARD